MRAATRRSYGGPEQVQIETLERPSPGRGEVLVEVAAAGLDRATLHLLDGKPYLARLAFGLRRPRQPVLGQQLAGRVVELGPEVTNLLVGQRVFGVGAGSFAEYAVARASALAETPEALRDVDAATLGVSGMTALEAVAWSPPAEGQRVLVLGGSGAVGSFVVQLAAHRGARVTALGSAGKLELMRRLGAQEVADYRRLSVAELAGGFDLIVDIGGNRPVSQLRSKLSQGGGLVIVGGESAGALLGGIERNLVASVVGRLTRQRLGWLFSRTTNAGLTELAGLVERGAVAPEIDRQVGLAQTPEVIAAMRRGELRGQAVVLPAR